MNIKQILNKNYTDLFETLDHDDSIYKRDKKKQRNIYTRDNSSQTSDIESKKKLPKQVEKVVKVKPQQLEKIPYEDPMLQFAQDTLNRKESSQQVEKVTSEDPPKQVEKVVKAKPQQVEKVTSEDPPKQVEKVVKTKPKKESLPAVFDYKNQSGDNNSTSDKSFISKYKGPLIIGGLSAVASAYLLKKWLDKKKRQKTKSNKKKMSRINKKTR